MLDQARSNDSRGQVEWVRSDVEGWDPAAAGAPIDVITSNALLQWVPTHQRLIPRWVSALAPGGWFAMQVPGNFNAPSHALLRELAARSSRAAELLPRLRGSDAIGELSAYTALLPIFGVLTDKGERAEFIAEYGRALARAYPREPFGTLFPFRRIFVVGHKGAAT